MEKVRPWCGQPSDRGRLRNRTELIYRPRRDERLSWPSWLTYSGWFTHISGHPSAIQVERRTAKARRPKTDVLPLDHATNGRFCSVVFARFRHCAPYLMHGSLGPPESTFPNANGISIASTVFVQLTAESPCTLQWAAPFSPQNCLFPQGDLDLRLMIIHGCLGLYRGPQPKPHPHIHRCRRLVAFASLSLTRGVHACDLPALEQPLAECQLRFQRTNEKRSRSVHAAV